MREQAIGPDCRWGLLVRRSKLNQDGTAGSVRRQEQVLRHHISQLKLGSVGPVYSEIVSAFDENAHRDGLDNALADLAAGRIDAIAAWRPDRLVRRVTQFRHVMVALEKAGGRLLFLKPMVIDTADTENLAFTTIFLDFLVAFAQMESEATSERLVLFHQDRARQGLPHRNSSLNKPELRPFGHTADWYGLVDGEVELIHEAAKRVLAGEYPNAIARDWTQREVRTPRGATRWGPDTIKCILTSARMVAQRSYGEALFDLEGVPPIMERDLWERLKVKLETVEGSPKVQRLLSGILRCGATCGLPLVGNLDRRGMPTYVCRKRRHERNACGGIESLCAPVDKVVGAHVVAFLNERDRVTALLARSAGSQAENPHARMAELNDSLTALDDARFSPPPGAQRLPGDRYWAQVARINEERDAIMRKLAVNREASMLAETLSVDWDEDEWEARPLAWRRNIIKLVVKQAVLEPRGQGKGRAGPAVFDSSRVVVEFAS
jgi:DNA invertase Pin-like site-specific DNA recombinase